MNIIQLNSDKVSHITNTPSEEVGHAVNVCHSDVAVAMSVQNVTLKYKHFTLIYEIFRLLQF